MELKWKLWFEKEGRRVIGKGGVEILKAIKEHGSISKASKALGMSYRFVWNYLNEMERVLGENVVERERGGREGGKTKLTRLGMELIEMFERAERVIEKALKFEEGVVEDVKDDVIVVRTKGSFRKGDRILILREDP